MKKGSVLASLLLTCSLLAAQTYSIKGKILDENRGPLPGANISLQYPWGEDVTALAAEVNGSFELKNIEKGGYVLKITYLGYEEFKREVTVNNRNLDLGDMQLTPGSTVLQEVQVKDRVPLGKVEGDTVSFSANAFKTMKDASAQDLVEKIPTVTVESGQVKAQGENVQQVLVDGKPFFGNDPTVALRNLPAEVIDKVQVFDQQSEQAQFTGVSDGNTTKTINIVTKKGMNTGQFGKLYAGYGYDDKYQAGGNINVFNGQRRISFIGMTNNINVQNFAFDDILGLMGSSGGNRMPGGGGFGGPGGGGGGFGGGGGRGGGGFAGDFMVQASGGIATTHAIGINYSDKWGEKLEVTGSYFFNKSRNNALKDLSRQFVDAEGNGPVYDELTTAKTDNLNHRLNFRIEWKLDSVNSFIFRPRVTWQTNKGDSEVEGITNRQNTLQNQLTNLLSTDYNALNFNSSLLWRHRFAKKGRTFSIDLSNGYAPKDGSSELFANSSIFFPVPEVIVLDQQSTLDANNWNVASNFEYTEPLGEYSQLSLNYRASWQQEDSEKLTYDYSEMLDGYDLLNAQLSNVFSNDYFTQQAGVGYNYNKGRDITLTTRANVQWAKLLNDQTFPYVQQFDQTFRNILPFAMLRYNFNQQRNIRIFYRTNTQLPSITQLQNVVDNSNPLQLRTGNPNLKQSFQQNLFFRYQNTNTEKSTVFFAMIGGGITNDYIGNSTYFANSDAPIFDSLDVQPGAQITRPVNLDGYRNLRSFTTYGIPLKPIKSNLNFNASYNFSRTPGLLNEQRNYASNHTVGVGITLASNISDKLDFTLSARPSWSRVNNTLQTRSNTEYLSQSSSLRFNWIIVEGFVFRTDLTHQLYAGLSQDFDQNYWLWNVGIGKKLFKNDRGEITLAINDLLEQNRSISRNVTETYIEDTWTNALQRFIMLSLTYNLRNFKLGEQQPAPSDGRPPMIWGPPPGN
jgi:hypothetical protein